jgi:formylglycine-generating enzyme required for sulfatase activity
MSLLRSSAALLAVAAAAASTFAADPFLSLDLGGGAKLDTVLVKAGTFRQGSPAGESGRGDDETARAVTLTADFYMGKLPVTRGQFARFADETRYRTEAEKGTSGGSGWDGQALVQRKDFTWRNPGFPQDDDHPVVLVTYDDALAFTQWLSRKTGRKVTLPTEAQWERACRAGSSSRFYKGASDGEARTLAWFKDNAGSGTHPAGLKAPNGFGLYDMSGNVYEWCRDWYGPYGDFAATDPEETRSTLSDKPRRVLRGGSWLKDARQVRCAARYRNTPGSRNADNGFRIALSTDPPAAVPVAGPSVAPRPATTVPAGRTVGGEGGETLMGLAEMAERSGLPYAVIGILAGLAFLLPIAFLAWLIKWVLRRSRPDVRTKPAEDGFWIYAPDETRGRTIQYRVRSDGATRVGTVDSPGSKGEFVYTGGKVEKVDILQVSAPLVSAMASRYDHDDDRRRREREDEERRRRERDDDERRRREERDSSSFNNYPSAY